jgi:hypothetical protein
MLWILTAGIIAATGSVIVGAGLAYRAEQDPERHERLQLVAGGLILAGFGVIGLALGTVFGAP